MFFTKSFSLNNYTESFVKNLILMNAIMLICVLNIQSSIAIHASEKVSFAKYILLTCVAVFALLNNFDIKIIDVKKKNFNNKNRVIYDYEFNHNDVHIEEIENAV
jgi:hypothetical protein